MRIKETKIYRYEELSDTANEYEFTEEGKRA